MDISTITAANGGATAPVQNSAVLSSDFETFLKMLTAQARYQDPLEPIDSSEYAAQLAQFSMVEQQVMSNDLLTALTAQLGAGNMAQLAGWIGMEARTTAPMLFDGTPIEITPKPAAGADQMQLIVRDGQDDEVQRITLPISNDTVEWAGVTTDGSPFASGLYSFEIESSTNGEVISTDPVQTYARIVETQRLGDETVLVLKGGSTISTIDVTALREPQQVEGDQQSSAANPA